MRRYLIHDRPPKHGAWGAAWLVLAFAALPGCGAGWGWYVVSPATEAGRANLSFLALGLVDTVSLSLLAMVIASGLGLLAAAAGFARHPIPRRCNRVYVEVFRAIPVLVLILWVYYGMPQLLGTSFGLSAFWAGVVALGLSESAFQAEIFRGGVQAVPRGQIEAAKTLGLSRWQTTRYIVGPQALRQILPPLGNQFVYVVKMSSLVSVIGLGELTRRANELIVTEYRPLEIYSILMLEYLILVLLISASVRHMERRLRAGES